MESILPLRIVSYRSSNGNVGDELNNILWPAVFGKDIFTKDRLEKEPEHNCDFFGIGSILSPEYLGQTQRALIFGAGARSVTPVSLADIDHEIYFVRGQNTARALGVSESLGISDPAILAPIFLSASSRTREATEIGYVPYFQTPPALSSLIANGIEASIISPHLEPMIFIERIQSCKLVISEAMHGCILADAYRVPWIPIRIFSAFYEGSTSEFKWEDWLSSVNLAFDGAETHFPRGVVLSRVVDRLEGKLIWTLIAPLVIRSIKRRLGARPALLSDLDILKERQDQILEKVDELRRKHLSFN